LRQREIVIYRRKRLLNHILLDDKKYATCFVQTRQGKPILTAKSRRWRYGVEGDSDAFIG